MLKSGIFIFFCAVFFCSCSGIPEKTAKEKPSIIYVSWGDEIAIGEGDGKLDTPEKIAKMMKFWAERFNAEFILWRVDDYTLRHHYKWANPDSWYPKLS